MLIAVLSLFFTDPAPIDMPRAEAFLVREDGARRLEDRYDRQDLWTTQATVGRWIDADWRTFVLCRLDVCPPAVDRYGTLTRRDYAEERVPMKRVRANGAFPRAFVESVAALAPCDIAEKPRPPRQLPRGFKHVYYWQLPTNYAAVVCTFLPEKSDVWYLATWQLAEEDDYALQMENFEDRFLKEDFPALVSRLGSQVPGGRAEDGRRKTEDAGRERELLRRDAHHSVAAYPNWHFTGAEEFAVIDDLPSRAFVEALTNDFSAMRAKYAAAIPTPLSGSNVLSVVRLYADRGEYLDALETVGITNMAWSAAYWSPQRRELVAYLPERGGDELLRTIRHEAFHQYLSYATAMIPASPWLNEGYAQHFEDDEDDRWGEGIDPTEEFVDRVAALLPGLLMMDYEQFYDGTDTERQLKYRLAWAVVRFVEKGADKVRLRPFEGLKGRYFRTLVDTQDMRKATAEAFKDPDTLRLFVAEWKKFWKKK